MHAPLHIFSLPHTLTGHVLKSLGEALPDIKQVLAEAVWKGSLVARKNG